MHQCAAGLVDKETGLPILKPTEFWASDFCLIESLSKMRCRCKGPHATLEGTYQGMPKTHAARVWPWKLAAAFANGVSELINRKYKRSYKKTSFTTRHDEIYPNDEVAEEEAPVVTPARSNYKEWKCEGCRNSGRRRALSTHEYEMNVISGH